MKKKLISLIAIILILAICNIVLIFLMQRQKNDAYVMVATLYPYTQKAICLEENLKYNIKFAQTKICDFAIIDKAKSEKKISDLFANCDSVLFVVRISDRFCHSCVESCVKLFDSDSLKSTFKFVYFIETDNFTKYEKEAKDLGIIDKDVYKVDFLESRIETVRFPYLMVMNKDLSIRYCYFPRKGYEHIDIEYLNIVFDIFAKNKS